MLTVQVVCRQYEQNEIDGVITCKYLVIKTVNRLVPRIGEILNDEQVRRLIANRKINVTILP